MDKPIKSIKLKKTFVKVLSESTAHGIPNFIKNEKNPIKMMWALFFLISIGLCAYLIISDIIIYFNYEVVTKIRQVNEFPSHFPTISICNVNYFTTDEALAYLKQVGSNLNYPDIFDDNVSNSLNSSYLKQTGLLYFLNGLGNTQKLNDTAKQALGYRLEDFMLDCQFIYQTCDLTKFEWFSHYYYGNCFKFNSGFDSNGNRTEVEVISRSSNFEGLSLSMFAGTPDKLRLASQGTHGMVVLIHNSSTSPLNVNAISLVGN